MKDKEELYGLVLAGGKSSRMGFDKGQIRYHQLPHRTFLYELLEESCSRAFLGLRKDQQEESEKRAVILDNANYHGPFRSILSAHDAFPEKAWLVLACDLPFLSAKTVQKLIKERDSSKAATVFFNRSSGFLEPLISIWEPESLRQAKVCGTEGGKCPRKFLMSLDIKIIQPEDDRELLNANFPADYEKALKELS